MKEYIPSGFKSWYEYNHSKLNKSTIFGGLFVFFALFAIEGIFNVVIL